MIDKFSSSKEKKAEILRLASSGASRPPRRNHPLGNVLAKYISESAFSFDADFKNKLQELRPDWFKFKEKRSLEIEKAALLKLAASGAEKPLPKKHPLGHKLKSYISHNSKCFDPEFKNKLQKIRPDWFQRYKGPETRKAALLNLATSGAEKPLLKKHPLGHNLASYISHGSKVFDPEFKDKLQEMRPDWFQRNHDPDLKKAALLKLAASGAEKPLPRKHQLGYDLKNYISHSSKCFDPEFKNKLQELRPDWF